MADRRIDNSADADGTSLGTPLPANVFDDRYAVDASSVDALDDSPTRNADDARRPTNGAAHNTTTANADDSDDDDNLYSPERDVAAAAGSENPRTQYRSRQPDPRSSIRKSRIGRSSYLAHDASFPQRTPSTYSNSSIANPRRSSLSADSNVFGDEHAAPFSGPSHPYGMYPQGVPRSASVTTASTTQRPVFPYGMYQQNVFADPDDEGSADIHTGFHVGFPGRTAGFHRQIGPDGEEQDIVGPDGHTEQLPPYSRYPDEGVKRPLEEEPATATAAVAHPSDPNSPLPSPGPNSLTSSARHSHISEHHDSAPLASGVEAPGSTDGESQASEKSWNEKSWREKRKTKVMGGRIPVWVLLLGAAMFAILAIVIGSVIGAFVARQRAAHADPFKEQASPMVSSSTQTASMFDASIIPVLPAGLPPLPTGTFRLPLGTPEEQQKGCLTNNSQFETWTCDAAGPPMNIQILPPNQIPGTPYGAAQIQPSDRVDGIIYGTQPPNMLRAQKLILVSDLDDPGRGPAYQFSAVYDKIVVLQSYALPGGVKQGNKRRDDGPAQPGGSNGSGGQGDRDKNSPVPQGGFTGQFGFGGPNGFRRHNRVEPGDSPWMCIWNNTFIEGFIYVNQSTGFALNAQSRPGMFSGPAPTQTSAANPASSGASATSPLANNKAAASSAGAPSSAPTQSFVPPYPKVVKVEERRLPKPSVPPYCQQLHVYQDGSVFPAQDKNGASIFIQISETDPSPAEFSSNYPPGPTGSQNMRRHPRRSGVSHSSGNKHLSKRDDPPGSCHCQWVSQ